VARFDIAADYTSMRHDVIEAPVATTDREAHQRKLIADYLYNARLGDVLAKGAKNCRHDLGKRRAICFGAGEKERTFFDLLGNEPEIGCEIQSGGDVPDLDFADLSIQEGSAQSLKMTRCHDQERAIARNEDWARPASLGQAAPILRHCWSDSGPKSRSRFLSAEQLVQISC
jgi:hypothetical protein